MNTAPYSLYIYKYVNMVLHCIYNASVEGPFQVRSQAKVLKESVLSGEIFI